MCFQLRDALRVGCIGLSSHFFTLTASGGKREMLNILADEMKNFCVLVEPPKNPFGKTKKTYSGKVGGRNDDVVIALQLAITVRRLRTTPHGCAMGIGVYSLYCAVSLPGLPHLLPIGPVQLVPTNAVIQELSGRCVAPVNTFFLITLTHLSTKRSTKPREVLPPASPLA